MTSSAPLSPALTPARVRAVNASLASISAGLRPVATQRDQAGTVLLRFRNGQLRREPGAGHSRQERRLRREYRRASRTWFRARSRRVDHGLPTSFPADA